MKMDIDTSWTVLIVGIVIFVVVGFLVSFYLLNTPTQKTPSGSVNKDSSKPCNTQPSNVFVTETNNTFNIQPMYSPAANSISVNNCFNNDTVSANHVVNTINKYGLQTKYVPLVMTYSVILCVYMDAMQKNCTNIPSSLNKLIVLGGVPNSASGATQLSYYTKVQNKPSKTTDFLVAAMDIISNYMASLVNENALTEDDRKAVRGFNYQFCRNYIDVINQNCQT